MPAPAIVTFTRIYPMGAGIEYEATPDRVRTVIASMNEHRDSSAPFKVRLRFDDGAVVTVCPKRQQKAAAHG